MIFSIDFFSYIYYIFLLISFSGFSKPPDTNSKPRMLWEWATGLNGPSDRSVGVLVPVQLGAARLLPTVRPVQLPLLPFVLPPRGAAPLRVRGYPRCRGLGILLSSGECLVSVWSVNEGMGEMSESVSWLVIGFRTSRQTQWVVMRMNKWMS